MIRPSTQCRLAAFLIMMLVLTWALMLCRATLPGSLSSSTPEDAGAVSVHAAHMMSGPTMSAPADSVATDCCADWQGNSPPVSEDRDLSATWELSYLWTLLTALTLFRLSVIPWHHWQRRGRHTHPSSPPLYRQHCSLLH